VDFVRGERTVKNLRLSKALTIPEGTTVSEACRRMAARRVDAVLLTDVNGLLSGIVTDKVHFSLEIFTDTCAGYCLEIKTRMTHVSRLRCTLAV
jgi:CBS domain-containing protein